MPLVTMPQDEPITGERTFAPAPLTENPKPPSPYPWDERWSAKLATMNPLSAAVRHGFMPDREPVQGYNPLTDEDLTGYDPRTFAFSTSPEQTQDIKTRTDAIREDERIAGTMGTGEGLAAGAVGVLGNPVYAPGVLVAPQSIAAMILMETGAEVLNESLLHSQQPERTFEESALNVGAVATFTGVLGGTVARLATRAEVKRAQEAVRNAAVDAEIDARSGKLAESEFNSNDRSAGAAETPKTTLDQETPVRDRVIGPIVNPSEKLGGKVVTTPAGRAMTESLSPAHRRNMQSVQDNYRTKAHEQGIGTPYTFQSLAGQADADMVRYNVIADQQYKLYVRANQDGENLLTKEQFNEEVARAMRRADRHEIPQVAEVARLYRKIENPRFDEEVELGMHGREMQDEYLNAVRQAERADDYAPNPSDVLKPVGADSYFPRVYLRKALDDQGTVSKFLTSATGRMVERLTAGPGNEPRRFIAKVKYKGVQGPVQPGVELPEDVVGYHPGLTHAEFVDLSESAKLAGLEVESVGTAKMDLKAAEELANDIAHDIVSNMKGGIVDPLSADYILPIAGSRHARTLGMFTDEELDMMGILANDAPAVLSMNTKARTRDRAMFRLFGDDRLGQWSRDVKKDYQPLIREAQRTGDVKREKELTELLNRDLKDVANLRGLMKGTFQMAEDPAGVAANISRIVRGVNTTTLLAPTVVTNLTDLAAPAIRHGAARVLREMGWKFIPGNYAAAKKVAQKYGLAVQAFEGTRFAQMAEVSPGGGNWYAKLLSGFGKVSGMNALTDLAETMASMVASRHIFDLLADFDKLGKDGIAFLAEIGITPDIAKPMLKELTEQGTHYKGVFDPQTLNWSNQEIAEIYLNAIRRDVRLGVVMPGLTDVPYWMNKGGAFEEFKLLAQFQRFPVASTNILMARGLQKADAQTMSGALLMLAMGGMVEAIKSGARGEDLTEREMGDFMVGGADRSGIFGWPMVLLAAGHSVAFNGKSSRYIEREPWSIFMGPSIGPIYDTARRVSRIGRDAVDVNKDVKPNDVWNAAKGVPFLNTLHLIDLIRLTVDGPGWRDNK